MEGRSSNDTAQNDESDRVRKLHRDLPRGPRRQLVPKKLTARRLSAYCEADDALPEKKCGLQRQRSTVDTMLMVRPLQEMRQRQGTPLCMHVYDSIDRAPPCGPSSRVSVSHLACQEYAVAPWLFTIFFHSGGERSPGVVSPRP